MAGPRAQRRHQLPGDLSPTQDDQEPEFCPTSKILIRLVVLKIDSQKNIFEDTSELRYTIGQDPSHIPEEHGT